MHRVAFLPHSDLKNQLCLITTKFLLRWGEKQTTLHDSYGPRCGAGAGLLASMNPITMIYLPSLHALLCHPFIRAPHAHCLVGTATSAGDESLEMPPIFGECFCWHFTHLCSCCTFLLPHEEHRTYHCAPFKTKSSPTLGLLCSV